MEYDRYKDNHLMYIGGIISLVLCLACVIFSLYILPFLIFGLRYDIPHFILLLLDWLQVDYSLSYPTSALLVWFLFSIPGLNAGFISYYVSNDIDNRLLGLEPEKNQLDVMENASELNRKRRESIDLAFKILFLMLLVVLVILLLHSIL